MEPKLVFICGKCGGLIRDDVCINCLLEKLIKLLLNIQESNKGLKAEELR